MRLVSMVPSITETLLECGFDVVGRTRYCIHPKDAVASIAIVGGTKDISWQKIKALNPDLLILDQEENPKRFADESPCPWWASHAEDLQSVPKDLLKLQKLLPQNDAFAKLIQRWQAVIQQPLKIQPKWSNFPGLIEWLNKPEETWQPQQVLYVIWKDPWMAVSKNTFIGSVLEFLKIEVPFFETKYPNIELSKYDPKITLLLFSSEPYAFAKHLDELKKLAFHSALVDGEKFSWFGVRSLKFLESQNK